MSIAIEHGHIIDPAIQLETFLADDVSDVEVDPFQIQCGFSADLILIAWPICTFIREKSVTLAKSHVALCQIKR